MRQHYVDETKPPTFDCLSCMCKTIGTNQIRHWKNHLYSKRTAVPCSIAVVLWKRNTPGSAIFFDPVWSVWQCCNTCCTWLNWDMYRLNMAGTWANGGLGGQQRDSSTKRQKAKEIWRLMWLMFKDHDTLNHRSFLWFLSGVAIRSPKLRKPHCCRACWCQFTCCCRDALQVYFGSWANVSGVTSCKPWQSCSCSPSFKDNNPTCSSLKFVLPPLPKHGSYGHWPRSVHGRRCREKTHRAWTTVNHSKSIQSSIYREEHYCFARVTKSMLVSLRARTCKTSYHPHTSIKKTQKHWKVKSINWNPTKILLKSHQQTQGHTLPEMGHLKKH